MGNFHNRVKPSCLWKTSMTVENCLDCRKLPRLWKTFLIVENFLHCEKTFSAKSSEN